MNGTLVGVDDNSRLLTDGQDGAMRGEKVELADIFRQFRDRLGPLHPAQWKVVNAIINCRTAVLGAHALICGSCGHTEISYNSCRNRHCPKCQSLSKFRWVEKQMDNLLPVPYFHAVFTVPDILRPLALHNKSLFYSLLFLAVSQTMKEVALDKKQLGARIGMITVLHTWDQRLNLHPHIHCLVPGGGLTADSSAWISSRSSFFLPVKVLSRVFRGKLLSSLEKAGAKGELSFEGYGGRMDTGAFRKLLKKSCRTHWVVYCKAPFAGPEKVIEYLGRYTHRVAITNNRIVSLSGDVVSFSWQDRRHGDARKIMSLNAVTFLKRFLLHTLPNGFVKIRYYGIFANPVKKFIQGVVKMALHFSRPPSGSASTDWCDTFQKITGIDMCVCAVCGAKEMRWVPCALPSSLIGLCDSG